MAKALILTTQAEKDIDDAYHWYEKQYRGLGKEFIDCVDVKMATVLHSPHTHQVIFKKLVRRAIVNRFPFPIYFVDEKYLVTIIAILHQHRNPTSWKARF